jgi:Tol biopolymer transport system component
LSPDGDAIIYGIKKGTESDNNHLYHHAFVSGKITQLTKHKHAESNVVWAKDGKSVYFLSTRSGSSQIWQLQLNTKSVQQISDFPLAVNGFKVADNGQLFALSFSVKPGCDSLDCSVAAQKADEEKKYNIRTYDNLMVRHWDTWTTDFKEQLFVSYINEQGLLIEAKNVMSDWQNDFAGISQVSIHPKATSLVFSAKDSSTLAATKNHAWTTNFDIFEVPLFAKQTRFELNNLTLNNKAWDASPVYSSNGRFLAYKSMQTPGYESDKFTLQLRDKRSGKTRAIASNWDRSISSLTFTSDNKSVLVVAQDVGQKKYFLYYA